VERRIARRQLRLLDVRPCLVQQLENVMIVDGVVDLPTSTPRAHEPHAAKQPELMGGGGLTDPDKRRDVADAELARRERVQNPDSGRISQGAESFRQRRHRASPNEARPPGGNVRKALVNAVAPVVRGRIVVS
jgi:hypothetical protein